MLAFFVKICVWGLLVVRCECVTNAYTNSSSELIRSTILAKIYIFSHTLQIHIHLHNFCGGRAWRRRKVCAANVRWSGTESWEYVCLFVTRRGCHQDRTWRLNITTRQEFPPAPSATPKNYRHTTSSGCGNIRISCPVVKGEKQIEFCQGDLWLALVAATWY